MRNRTENSLRPARRLPLRRPRLGARILLPSLLVGGVFVLAVTVQPAVAIGTSVNLGTVGSYSVLGGESVTNTGLSVLSGNVGVSPGTGATGFPPGTTGGVIHAADAHAAQAKADLLTAYDNAAGQASDATIGAELGGLVLEPGVYTAPSSTQITGPLVLDAKGDPGAVFIFQIGSGLTTASSSSVVLLNDAQSCHVFWQVAESATLGTSTTFVGTIMALTSIVVRTGATVEGRALARNGSVTLDDNVFTDSSCSTVPTSSPSPTTTATVTASPVVSPTVTGTPTVSATSTSSPVAAGTAAATTTATSSPRPTRSASVGAAGHSSPGGGSSGGPLALTGGGNPVPLIMIAIGAGLGGLVLVLAGRRRRTT